MKVSKALKLCSDISRDRITVDTPGHADSMAESDSYQCRIDPPSTQVDSVYDQFTSIRSVKFKNNKHTRPASAFSKPITSASCLIKAIPSSSRQDMPSVPAPNQSLDADLHSDTFLTSVRFDRPESAFTQKTQKLFRNRSLSSLRNSHQVAKYGSTGSSALDFHKWRVQERSKRQMVKQEFLQKVGELLPYNGKNKEPEFNDMVDELIATSQKIKHDQTEVNEIKSLISLTYKNIEAHNSLLEGIQSDLYKLNQKANHVLDNKESDPQTQKREGKQKVVVQDYGVEAAPKMRDIFSGLGKKVKKGGKPQWNVSTRVKHPVQKSKQVAKVRPKKPRPHSAIGLVEGKVDVKIASRHITPKNRPRISNYDKDPKQGLDGCQMVEYLKQEKVRQIINQEQRKVVDKVSSPNNHTERSEYTDVRAQVLGKVVEPVKEEAEESDSVIGGNASTSDLFDTYSHSQDPKSKDQLYKILDLKTKNKKRSGKGSGYVKFQGNFGDPDQRKEIQSRQVCEDLLKKQDKRYKKLQISRPGSAYQMWKSGTKTDSKVNYLKMRRSATAKDREKISKIMNKDDKKDHKQISYMVSKLPTEPQKELVQVRQELKEELLDQVVESQINIPSKRDLGREKNQSKKLMNQVMKINYEMREFQKDMEDKLIGTVKEIGCPSRLLQPPPGPKHDPYLDEFDKMIKHGTKHIKINPSPKKQQYRSIKPRVNTGKHQRTPSLPYQASVSSFNSKLPSTRPPTHKRKNSVQYSTNMGAKQKLNKSGSKVSFMHNRSISEYTGQSSRRPSNRNTSARGVTTSGEFVQPWDVISHKELNVPSHVSMNTNHVRRKKKLKNEITILTLGEEIDKAGKKRYRPRSNLTSKRGVPTSRQYI